jgi:hypothetical protein
LPLTRNSTTVAETTTCSNFLILIEFQASATLWRFYVG